MAQFACTARLAVHQLAIHHDAASHARAEGEGDEVFHAFGAAVNEFAISGGVGVVGNHDRHVQEAVEH